MSRRFLVACAFLATLATPAANAESTSDVGLRFGPEEGLDAIQPGCTTFSYEHNPCHQIAAMMNGLDSPKIDVLILVPVGPFAERDMRITRQSTEMWADGIDFLAADMGLQWLADGVEFHIFMEMVNTGESEFTTYPIVDPEIVIVATNPVGGIGIGIDPIDFAGIIFGEGAGQGPCHGVANPFDITLWQNLPGFDSHHGGRSGTYTEDCGGSGGNICFSVNGAIDPATDVIDIFQLYDLTSHETGHCLTLGHVGDGAEGSWSSVPTNDIMAYSSDPPGVSKCVSTLDVEAFAVAMSHYLDVNGDGVVNPDDRVFANDAEGEGDGRPFQVQHPNNHYYASPTRQAIDCVQPDMGPVPMVEIVNFTPAAPARDWLVLDDRADGSPVAPRLVQVAGRVATGGSGSVVLNVTAAPTLEGNHTGLGIANVTVPIVDGAWSAVADLRGLPEGMAVVVSAIWLDASGAVVDSDQVQYVIDADAPAPNAQDAAATPVPAALALLTVLAGVAWASRRRAS